MKHKHNVNIAGNSICLFSLDEEGCGLERVDMIDGIYFDGSDGFNALLAPPRRIDNHSILEPVVLVDSHVELGICDNSEAS